MHIIQFCDLSNQCANKYSKSLQSRIVGSLRSPCLATSLQYSGFLVYMYLPTMDDRGLHHTHPALPNLENKF